MENWVWGAIVETRQLDDAIRYLDDKGIKYKFLHEDWRTVEFYYEPTPYNREVFKNMKNFLESLDKSTEM